MKGISPLIGFALTVLLVTVSVAIVMTTIIPAFERMQDSSVVDEGVRSLQLIDVAIRQVASEAEGSRRAVSIRFTEGKLRVDASKELLIFEYEPKSDFEIEGLLEGVFIDKLPYYVNYFNYYKESSIPNDLNCNGTCKIENAQLALKGFVWKNIGLIKNFKVEGKIISGAPGSQIFMLPTDFNSLTLYMTFDELYGKRIFDYSLSGHVGNLSGNIIGDFENNLDGFNVNCGGVPDYEYVNGKIGKGVKIWATGGDGLACIYKSLDSPKTAGYEIWFYGMGYVRAGLWNGTQYVTYIVDVESGCRTPYGNPYVYSQCNGGKPYDSWKLFKLVVYVDSITTPTIYFYNQGTAGENYASYYDFVTDGPIWQNGIIGGSMTFEGKDDFIVTNYSGSFKQEMTISLWARLQSWDNEGLIGRYHYSNGIGQGWMLYRNSSWDVGQIAWLFVYNTTFGGSLSLLRIYNNLELDRWYHFAIVIFPNGTIKSYLDGMLYSATTPKLFSSWGGNSTNESTPLFIGKGGAVNLLFNGSIDELMIFNRALNNKEIESIYKLNKMKLLSSGYTNVVNEEINLTLVLSSPIAKSYFDNIKVKSTLNKLVLQIPYSRVDIERNLSIGPGNNLVLIEKIGFNDDIRKPVIRVRLLG